MARIVSNATAISEWYSNIAGDNECCGEASVAMALHVVKGAPATTAFVTQLGQECVNSGHVTDAPRASTTPSDLQWLAKQHGMPLEHHGPDWQQTVRAYAGVRPIIFGISNATAFGGHDSTIHGHYICIFGVDSQGMYIVGDPNTPEATSGGLVRYSMQQLQDAVPYDHANGIDMGALIPDNNPLSSIPGLGQAAQIASSATRHAPGFTGIAQALQDDGQLTAPSIGTVTDIPGWLWSNGKAFLLRGLVILIGTIFLLALLIQVIKQYDPQFFDELQRVQQGGGTVASALPGAQQLAGSVGSTGGAGADAGAGAGMAAVAV